MILKLKNTNRIPYGGRYYVTDPLTQIEVMAINFDSLMERVKEERRAMSAPIGLGLGDEVEQWVCAKYPDECSGFNPSLPNRRTTLGLSDILNGTKVMLSLWRSGGVLVDRVEAERRASICVKCPYNVTFSKPCGGLCPELENLVSGIVSHQGTQFDRELRSCGICGCFLQAAIWVPLENQCSGLSGFQKEQFQTIRRELPCWKTCDS
jgi:hypothetical protein